MSTSDLTQSRKGRLSRPIILTGVKQNNLKNIDVEIPARKLTVITGLSGSGKSSLAFDTLYAEGQRRYVESLSTYTRQFLEKMPKPDLVSIENIPPAIALEQRNPVLGSRSTVGTQTEIMDYLRVLFARIGKTLCLDCGGEVKKHDVQSMLEVSLKWFPGKKAAILAPLILAKSEKKMKKATGPTLESLFSTLKEQGFSRVLWKSLKKKNHLVFDLNDPAPDKKLLSDEWWIIVDRLALTHERNPPDSTRSRILDSLELALRVGSGKVSFFDFEKSKLLDFDSRFACVKCRKEAPIPEPDLFSFNSPLGACPTCNGFGHTLGLDENLIVPDPTRTLKNGAIDPFSKPSLSDWQDDLFRFAERHKISIGKRYMELNSSQKKLLWEGDPHDKTFPGIHKCFDHLARYKYKLHIRVFIRRYQSQNLCTTCKGARLKPQALQVLVNNTSLPALLALPVRDAKIWFEKFKPSSRDEKISDEPLRQVRRRLEVLDAVGVNYLSLDRPAKTLSGGEFQRIQLATQLGNGLCGTLYVLDEPSIGLHAADTDRLLEVLKDLRDTGNTLVVVEHDMEIIRQADWLIELGPGSGTRGGEVIASGTLAELKASEQSNTRKYFEPGIRLSPDRLPRSRNTPVLRVTGCRENNLKNIDVEFPTEKFVVISGVSGSGKSTLLHQTLYPAVARFFNVPLQREQLTEPGRFKNIYGAEHFRGIQFMDQKPIGRSSRSNPATYIRAWDEIRRLYSNQSLSLRRGYTKQYFSFNVDGGRCPTCRGEGEIVLDMHFLADIRIPCEECQGKRFKKSLLDVAYRGKNIHQLLQLTIDEAYDLFRDNPELSARFSVLRDVGLGYLQVGQSATTLSGGECQRLKIASCLLERSQTRMLYLFDEPTTGLHQEDVRKLLGVLQDLVDAHNTIIMIEHHLDVIAQSDWVIDLGPQGGHLGGELVTAGTPFQITKHPQSVTGAMLRKAGFQFPTSQDRPGRQSQGSNLNLQ